MLTPAPRRVIATLLAVWLAGCATARPTAPVPRPVGEFRPMAVGLCEDYPEETRSIADARRDLDAMRRAGVNALRIAIGWDGVESERGRYDWAFWDDFIHLATTDYGIQLIPYICYTPRWAATDQGENYWRSPPRDNADFARFVAAAARRYKGQIHSWELWNEPDNPQYWTGTVAQFATLIKAGARAVREADPDAKIVLGGIAWRTDFVGELLKDHGVSPSVDVINAHSYYETWSPEPAERLPEFIRRLDDLIAWYGNGQPIWMAEVGYSDFKRGDEVSSVYRGRMRYEHTPPYQAVELFRMLTLIQSTGLVSLAAWYRINDLPAGEAVIGDVNNRHLGLLRTDRADKPAMAALRFFNEVLGDQRARCIDPWTLVRRTAASESEVHCFQRADGEVVVVGWLRANVPGLRPAGGEDRREEVVEVELPGGYGGGGVYDEGGRREGQVRAARDGGITRLTGVRLAGGGVVVIRLRPVGG